MKNIFGLLAREGHLFALNLDINFSMPVNKNTKLYAISKYPHQVGSGNAPNMEQTGTLVGNFEFNP